MIFESKDFNWINLRWRLKSTNSSHVDTSEWRHFLKYTCLGFYFMVTKNCWLESYFKAKLHFLYHFIVNIKFVNQHLNTLLKKVHGIVIVTRVYKLIWTISHDQTRIVYLCTLFVIFFLSVCRMQCARQEQQCLEW